MQFYTFFIQEVSIMHTSDISFLIVGVSFNIKHITAYLYNIKYDNVLCPLNLKTHLRLSMYVSICVCMYSLFFFYLTYSSIKSPNFVRSNYKIQKLKVLLCYAYCLDMLVKI